MGRFGAIYFEILPPASRQRRNFLVLALNLILGRIGWIFKTETVVIPGFLDLLTPSATVRGFLPLVNRLSQSFPQLLLAHIISGRPRQNSAYLAGSLLMALPWAVLAGAVGLWPQMPTRALLGLFWIMYALHCVTFGSLNLLGGTVQGKLIAAHWRGRLLAFSSFLGCGSAIVLAMVLLPRWLDDTRECFAWIFGATAAFFVLAGLALLGVREVPTPQKGPEVTFPRFLRDSVTLVRRDANFRRLIGVVCLFFVTLLLFPHYTVFGKRELGLQARNFVVLLVAQNTVHAVGSLLFGTLADRIGNRGVIGLLLFLCSGVPLLAIGLSRLPSEVGRAWFWLIYACLGVTPVTMRLFVNYTLEIAPPEQHPQYLGTLNALQVLPLLGAPLIGALIDWFSFDQVFIGCALVILGGAGLMFGLEEPRREARG